MLDRSVAPVSSPITSIDIAKASSLTIPVSEMPLHFLIAGEQPVVKFELVIEKSVLNDIKPGLSLVSAKMFSKGTANKTAHQLAEEIDSYGAFIGSGVGMDNVSLHFYCLKKHFKPVLNIFMEMLTSSVFPQEELDLLIKQLQQELKINWTKNNYTASHTLRNKLYTSHSYGNSLTHNDLDKITQKDIVEFYEQKLNTSLFLCGAISQIEIDEVKERFSQVKHVTSARDIVPLCSNSPAHNEIELVKRPGASQSSIRLGKKIENKSHPDYIKFFLTNQLLGGFFGSRLMKNIREKKGLTYGIYSSMAHLNQSSFMMIGAEVAREKTKNALDEIIIEIKELQENLVSSDELTLVRNHTLGKFASSIDTPFALMEKFKGLYFHGLDYNFYDQYFDQLHEIEPKDILEMANLYMKTEEFSTIVVGDLS